MKTTMRDTFLATVLEEMRASPDVVLLSADFGAPAIDAIRAEFPDRFVNVGIAEQNLINLATGFALEGFRVIGYAIAPFITMRCFEQIRVSLAILSQLRPMNVTLVGVGAGFSYDVSGPTHHCIEDLAVMSALPNLSVYSLSDHTQAPLFAKHCLTTPGIKYLRFDAKPHEPVCDAGNDGLIERGFRVLNSGRDLAIVSTGYMSHVAWSLLPELRDEGIDPLLIDLVAYNCVDTAALEAELAHAPRTLLLQEAVLDRSIENSLRRMAGGKLEAMGVGDRYIFEIGSRDQIHDAAGIGRAQVLDRILRHHAALA
ncbi:transketolase family protein [Niveibacterium sp.]|uniref:transketolase family protein n=1 Tax=Niveibacterium sp. TaxID=2017444 RepID=UPI0035B38D4A